MTQHDFAPLFDLYPGIIHRMPNEFTSHQFILSLAQAQQLEYINALNDYRGLRTAPFRRVHAILAKHLKAYPDLVILSGWNQALTYSGSVMPAPGGVRSRLLIRSDTERYLRLPKSKRPGGNG